jgi:hypothetical protein
MHTKTCEQVTWNAWVLEARCLGEHLECSPCGNLAVPGRGCAEALAGSGGAAVALA